MSKYIDGTRAVYFDDRNGNLTVPGTLFVGNLNASTTTVTNDIFGTVGNNFVHYDSLNQTLVYNQTGGGGGGGGSGVVNASTVTTILDVVASGHLIGQETSQIVDYDFTQFGSKWNSVVSAGTHGYYGAAINATGKYQIMSVDATTLLISNNYGRSFAASSLPSILCITPSISASGQYMYAGNFVASGSIYKSSDYGASWSSLSPAGQWSQVVCSADGQYVLAGGLGDVPQMSTNFGASWFALPLPSGNWVFGVSATGQYMIGNATNSGGPLYISSTFGSSWTPVPGTGRTYQFCTASGNGKYMLAGAFGNLFFSSDYGASWSLSAYAVGSFFPALSIDFSGQYQAVSVKFGPPAYSRDFGATFTSATSGNSDAIGISANAQYMITGQNDSYIYTSSVPTLIPEITATSIIATTDITATAVTANTVIGISSIVAPASFYAQELYTTTPFVTEQFAKTWVSRTAAIPFWGFSAMSASGQFRALFTRPSSGSALYISPDYGTTWSPTALSYLVNSMAMSASGQYIVLTSNSIGEGAGFIYVSNDYGTTFSQTSTARSWGYIAMSASGQYMTATVSGSALYRSSDYGATFNAVIASPIAAWTGVVVSASGQFQTVVIVVGGLPYRSSDFGVTFARISSGPSTNYQDIGMSASGQYQTIVANPGKFWISSNYGVTFNEIAASLPPPQIWSAPSISASGQYQVIAAYEQATGPLYASIDYGITWAPVATGLPSANWRGLSISASGQYLTLANYDSGAGGNIWTCAAPTLFPAITTTTAGINCNAPQYTLDVNGLAHQSNNSASWYVVSDRRIKTDIVNADLAICMSSIKALPLRYYQYDRILFPNREDKHVIGCVAQEVQLVFPKAVGCHSNYGISDLRGLDYDQIYKANLGATQYLGGLVESQSTQIAALTSQVSTLSHSLSYMTSTLNVTPPC